MATLVLGSLWLHPVPAEPERSEKHVGWSRDEAAICAPLELGSWPALPVLRRSEQGIWRQRGRAETDSDFLLMSAPKKPLQELTLASVMGQSLHFIHAMRKHLRSPRAEERDGRSRGDRKPRKRLQQCLLKQLLSLNLWIVTPLGSTDPFAGVA